MLSVSAKLAPLRYMPQVSRELLVEFQPHSYSVQIKGKEW